MEPLKENRRKQYQHNRFLRPATPFKQIIYKKNFILPTVIFFRNELLRIYTLEKAVKTEFNKLRVLDILHENLKQASPMAVYTDDISLQLKLSHTHLKDILLRMHHSGDILCANDGNCSIITKQGLHNYLNSNSV